MVSLLPTAKRVAAPALDPISRVPPSTLCTTKAVTVPSVSASLPLSASSANVISTSVSSAVVSTAAEKDVRVGGALKKSTAPSVLA